MKLVMTRGQQISAGLAGSRVRVVVAQRLHALRPSPGPADRRGWAPLKRPRRLQAYMATDLPGCRKSPGAEILTDFCGAGARIGTPARLPSGGQAPRRKLNNNRTRETERQWH